MARPLRIEYPGAFYHVTSRGNERRKIFDSNRDREQFLDYLEKANQRFKIVIHTYCLMDNHYHLLVETPGANVSKCMQFVNSSYTTYYNLRRKRIGHLFQGRYKAILVDKDYYAKELSRYIHLNPVRAKITKKPEEYPWSSYHYYIYSTKKKPLFLRTEFILSYFSDEKAEAQKAYKKFVEEGLSKEISNPLDEVTAGVILGSHNFVQKIKDKYLDREKKVRDLPSLRKLRKNYISSENIINFLKEENNLMERERSKIIIYLLRKYTDNTLEEIAKKFTKGMSASAVSQSCRRIEKKREEDKTLDRKLRIIENKLSNVEV